MKGHPQGKKIILLESNRQFWDDHKVTLPSSAKNDAYRVLHHQNFMIFPIKLHWLEERDKLNVPVMSITIQLSYVPLDLKSSVVTSVLLAP